LNVRLIQEASTIYRSSINPELRAAFYDREEYFWGIRTIFVGEFIVNTFEFYRFKSCSLRVLNLENGD
jgi:hypothetical protein